MSIAMLPSMTGGDAYVRNMNYLIQSIINTGAVFMTGSGNAGKDGAGPKPTFPSLYDEGHGASFAAPTVAGLALFLRALEPGLATAASLKSRILELTYVREAPADKKPSDFYQPMIWDGQLIGGGDARGAPSPTCAAGGCGQFYRGFFCEGTPIQTDPGFLGPRNPDSVQNPASPKHSQWVEPDPRDPVNPGVIIKEPYNPFPSIPPASGCATTTSTVRCMGSGGRQACYTATGVCVTAPPTMPTPTVIGSASCPTSSHCVVTKIEPTDCRSVPARRTAIPEVPSALTISSPDPMMTSASSPSAASGDLRPDVVAQQEQAKVDARVDHNKTTGMAVIN
ncbi:hypothetical protein B0T14DRAFT_569660 [Immersiella caudata]|uniref:Subtilisin n=1 Tax=Immersiella caudata TaxID=314043 RepID=A0AA39WE01_9PEZI|nr:hypothetical protein B0T14DRAFT_569660 [Immersiella caudata]